MKFLFVVAFITTSTTTLAYGYNNNTLHTNFTKRIDGCKHTSNNLKNKLFVSLFALILTIGIIGNVFDRHFNFQGVTFKSRQHIYRIVSSNRSRSGTLYTTI